MSNLETSQIRITSLSLNNDKFSVMDCANCWLAQSATHRIKLEVGHVDGVVAEDSVVVAVVGVAESRVVQRRVETPPHGVSAPQRLQLDKLGLLCTHTHAHTTPMARLLFPKTRHMRSRPFET